MKKQNHRIPTYVFIVAAVLGSWGIAIAKTIFTTAKYPQITGADLPSIDVQYQYIFAFLFQ